MKLEVKRIGDSGDATIGAFYINGVFQCFTIEDEERQAKVKGETRVPEGTYDVTLRNAGTYHDRYTDKFGSMHVGMLAVHNAPDYKLINNGIEFQYILIHVGNYERNTMGCLLLNDAANSVSYEGSGSTSAYKRVYPKIAAALMDDEKVTITYTDIETGK